MKKEEMTKQERVMAAVRGEDVDRVPVSFFGHKHSMEGSSEVLAPYLLDWNQKFEWDFIKVNLRFSYYQEAWGCTYNFDPVLGPQLIDYVVKSPADLLKLKAQDPTKGVLADQVNVTRLLREYLKEPIPCVQTLFSPLAIVGFLAGAKINSPDETAIIPNWIKNHPDELHQGLDTVTKTLANYVKESVRAGANGIFLTTLAYASRHFLTDEEYREFGAKYDLELFNAAIDEGADLNILHVCRDNAMVDTLLDYPVEVISYDSGEPHNPSLEEVMALTDKALWGGVRQSNTLWRGPVNAIHDEVHEALEQTKGKRFILGPGCSIPPTGVHEDHLKAVMAAARSYGK